MKVGFEGVEKREGGGKGHFDAEKGDAEQEVP